jgi:K+-transporting ATPase KdpF subunit
VSWGDIGSLVIAALVFVYLLVALLKPERFG